MEIHFDKIIPVIIAAVLIYLNVRKKNKKAGPVSKTSSGEVQSPQRTTGQDIFSPFFKGLDDLLNISQPAVQVASEPEPQENPKKPKEEPIAPEPAKVPVPSAKVVVHEPVVEVEYFDFDVKRAIIDAEIINRKYFTI